MANTSVGRSKKQMRKVPVIDLSLCSNCDSCLFVAAEVFQRNTETGIIEVMDLTVYPEEAVEQAIVLCPADCIDWEGAS